MSLYHGTSAASALSILVDGNIRPSKDGFFYCFDSTRPESLAGALCFATGDGPRNGSLREKNFFAQYARMNPDFPTGIRGIFFKVALKRVAASWARAQMEHSTSKLGRHAAILVFEDNPAAISRTRNGFVNEMKIAADDTPSLRMLCAYFDDSLLGTNHLNPLQGKSVVIRPLSDISKQLKL